jgi:hypothetical protein
MRSSIIAAIAALLVSAASTDAKEENINPTLRQITASHGGCVPVGIISFKEIDRLRSAGYAIKGEDCIKPSLLSDEELARDRTWEAEQMRHPPTVMTVSWIEDDIKDYHRNFLDPLFAQMPECNGVRVMHLADSVNHSIDVQLAAQFVVQRTPLVIKYSIDRDNIVTALDPKSVVRLACHSAKAKNPSP